MINRKILKQRLHESYERHPSMKHYDCFYCNAPGDNEDHVPPLTLAETYSGYDRILVRSCRECNVLLGNRIFLTLFSRCEYLAMRYRKRWRKDLDMPHWKDEEIEELRGSLKREIIIGMKRKARANAVLTNLEKNMEMLLGDLNDISLEEKERT